MSYRDSLKTAAEIVEANGDLKLAAILRELALSRDIIHLDIRRDNDQMFARYRVDQAKR